MTPEEGYHELLYCDGWWDASAKLASDEILLAGYEYCLDTGRSYVNSYLAREIKSRPHLHVAAKLLGIPI